MPANTPLLATTSNAARMPWVLAASNTKIPQFRAQVVCTLWCMHSSLGVQSVGSDIACRSCRAFMMCWVHRKIPYAVDSVSQIGVAKVRVPLPSCRR